MPCPHKAEGEREGEREGKREGGRGEREGGREGGERALVSSLRALIPSQGPRPRVSSNPDHRPKARLQMR